MTPAKSQKDKLHHPDSRKASQLVRRHLRKSKLGSAASKRRKNGYSQGTHTHHAKSCFTDPTSCTVDVYGFFYHAMPDEGVMTLDELHTLVRDIWLTRHDQEIDQERAARRQGRPKSTKEVKLEETKLRELEIYKTGMGMFNRIHLKQSTYSLSHISPEVPDLTHPANVELFRRWDQKELAFIQLLRFIRISSADPHVAVVSRPGKHATLLPEQPQVSRDPPSMDVDSVESATPAKPPPLFADSARLGSTMLAMDGPLY